MSKQAKIHQGMETFYCIIYHYFYLSIDTLSPHTREPVSVLLTIKILISFGNKAWMRKNKTCHNNFR